MDRQGYVEERIYESEIDWQAEYERITSSPKRDMMKAGGKAFIPKAFPDAYCFTKRMAEELLLRMNQNRVPLLILRPSIIGASLSEPTPGWTDNTSLLNGVTLLVGLGIMRDLRGIPGAFLDVVPVDLVVKQILQSIVSLAVQYKESGGQKNVLVSHASTSALNPVTLKGFFRDLAEYQNKFPYEKRAGKAHFVVHQDQKNYNNSVRFKN